MDWLAESLTAVLTFAKAVTGSSPKGLPPRQLLVLRSFVPLIEFQGCDSNSGEDVHSRRYRLTAKWAG